jgi:type II secretory pathway pseudopilin PulG
MLRSNARKQNRGFTLLENTIIIVIIGILLALSTPSMLDMVDRARLSQAVTDVRGALQESQRQAIQKSEPCFVRLNVTHGEVTGGCLVTGDRKLPERIKMVTNLSSTNGSDIEIGFGILGTAKFNIQVSVPGPLSDPSGKIVFYISQGSTQNRKCIAISNTLGLTRAGVYSGPLTGTGISEEGVCTAASA